MPQNLALWSEDFSNAVWTQIESFTANAVAQPLSPFSVTADKVHDTNTLAGQNIFLQQINVPVLTGSTYNISAYMKLAGTADGDGLATLTIQRAVSGPFQSEALNIQLTSSWQRFQIPITWTANYPAFRHALQTLVGGVRDIHIWGAQANVGRYALPYVKTSGTIINTSPTLIVDPSTNILALDAIGSDLLSWLSLEGATHTPIGITFPQESSGTPARVQFTFEVGRFPLGVAHRFTGFLTPTTLNYPHTDIKWFVKNETTGEVQFHQMTFDGHADQGGQSEIGEAKPFNIVFYSKAVTDQFTVGFENFANNQPGCTFEVSGQGVYIVV